MGRIGPVGVDFDDEFELVVGYEALSKAMHLLEPAFARSVKLTLWIGQPMQLRGACLNGSWWFSLRA